MKAFFLFMLALCMAASSAAQAQQHIREMDVNRALQQFGKGESEPPPKEPYLPEVVYEEIAPPKDLDERIDRLLLGISADVPPHYDHYGYEIRRHMAHIAGPEVLADEAGLEEQIKNIRKARVILQYWERALFKEMKTIEAEIEAMDEPSPKLISGFRHNRGQVGAFMVEARAWMEHNEEVLTYLYARPGQYKVVWPNVYFRSAGNRGEFINHMSMARQAHKQIQTYFPFANMVY